LVSSRGAWGEIVVADDGDGIPEDQRERIFESYQRAGDQADSVGLGLSVSRLLAGLMGGALDYEYVDGESRFMLRLPAAAS
jgi:signal transduction histidine kinase